MSKISGTKEEKVKAYLKKSNTRDNRVRWMFRRVLQFAENLIAVVTICVLFAALGVEIYSMFTESGYFTEVEDVLHGILTIVVGFEFVRMLIDTTPANIIEVLTVAITRHVVLSHDDPLSNLACIACIAGLFAIRRFLVRPNELREDMADLEEE